MICTRTGVNIAGMTDVTSLMSPGLGLEGSGGALEEGAVSFGQLLSAVKLSSGAPAAENNDALSMPAGKAPRREKDEDDGARPAADDGGMMAAVALAQSMPQPIAVPLPADDLRGVAGPVATVSSDGGRSVAEDISLPSRQNGAQWQPAAKAAVEALSGVLPLADGSEAGSRLAPTTLARQGDTAAKDMAGTAVPMARALATGVLIASDAKALAQPMSGVASQAAPMAGAAAATVKDCSPSALIVPAPAVELTPVSRVEARLAAADPQALDRSNIVRASGQAESVSVSSVDTSEASLAAFGAPLSVTMASAAKPSMTKPLAPLEVPPYAEENAAPQTLETERPSNGSTSGSAGEQFVALVQRSAKRDEPVEAHQSGAPVSRDSRSTIVERAQVVSGQRVAESGSLSRAVSSDAPSDQPPATRAAAPERTNVELPGAVLTATVPRQSAAATPAVQFAEPVAVKHSAAEPPPPVLAPVAEFGPAAVHVAEPGLERRSKIVAVTGAAEVQEVGATAPRKLSAASAPVRVAAIASDEGSSVKAISPHRVEAGAATVADRAATTSSQPEEDAPSVDSAVIAAPVALAPAAEPAAEVAATTAVSEPRTIAEDAPAATPAPRASAENAQATVVSPAPVEVAPVDAPASVQKQGGEVTAAKGAVVSLRAKGVGRTGMKDDAPRKSRGAERSPSRDLTDASGVSSAAAPEDAKRNQQQDSAPDPAAPAPVAPTPAAPATPMHTFATTPVHASALDTAAAKPVGSAAESRPDVAVADQIPAKALPAIQTAKLIQGIGQTEMRVGIRTAEFGNVSIHTSSTAETMSAQISVEHGELAKALTAHIPEMQAQMGAGTRSSVQVDLSGQGTGAPMSGSGTGGQQQPEGSRGGRQFSGEGMGYFGRNSKESTYAPLSAVLASGDGGANVRLDVRV